MGIELPRPRVPLSERRCTCIWEPGYRSGRAMPDPLCPASVLHVDDDARLVATVDALLGDVITPPSA